MSVLSAGVGNGVYLLYDPVRETNKNAVFSGSFLCYLILCSVYLGVPLSFSLVSHYPLDQKEFPSAIVPTEKIVFDFLFLNNGWQHYVVTDSDKPLYSITIYESKYERNFVFLLFF